jgi:hypothetical protein
VHALRDTCPAPPRIWQLAAPQLSALILLIKSITVCMFLLFTTKTIPPLCLIWSCRYFCNGETLPVSDLNSNETNFPLIHAMQSGCPLVDADIIFI